MKKIYIIIIIIIMKKMTYNKIYKILFFEKIKLITTNYYVHKKII